MKLSNKGRYKLTLYLCSALAIIGVAVLFAINWSLIIQAFQSYEGAFEVLLVISIRILILFVTVFYLFHKWFKQEAQYLSDIPFLLGMFFLILIFGKAIDLLWDLTFFTFNDEIVLVFLKFRFFIIIFEVAPLLYLGMEIIFFRLEDRYNKLKDKQYMNRLRKLLISIIILSESTVIIIGPNFTVMGIILPIILIPSLFGIVYIFYMAYSLNRLSIVKPGILAISFFLYMLSNIFRPVMQNILGETASYIIVVEMVDIIIFMII
ncbi:MAG: hypothetical protein ACFE8B_07395, partial [Candidatus Hermodarchaeota archaeon]